MLLHKLATDPEFMRKTVALAELVEKEQRERAERHYPGSTERRPGDYNAAIIDGVKYTRIDFPHGNGKLMIVPETGEIFGIKAYGVIHRGHAYGTLDTIHNWYWGEYYPARRKVEAPNA